MRRSERGQGTVEWVGLLLVVALLLAGLVAAGVRVPGMAVARAIAGRILCAVALARECDDEPALIAAYGTEVGRLVRRHMPTLVYERGSRAVPVDFRRCRETSCGDGAAHGRVTRTDAGLPVTAFAHVVDCRAEAAARAEAMGADCSGERAGNLYIQYWTYYADSATLRMLIGAAGYHHDDWEGVEVRIRPDGSAEARASSHNGFNYGNSPFNWISDVGVGPLEDAAELARVRPHHGWGPETRLLFISGGSHAGRVNGGRGGGRFTPARRVHLVPLEPIAANNSFRFAVSPPWRKRLWRDPEAERTD